jgi:hypothetical protein
MIYREKILPRLNFIPFAISRIVVEIINIFTFTKFQVIPNRKSIICIESGIKGWELIEYKELIWSAIEYLSEENVKKIEINKSSNYIKQIQNAISKNKPTHYIYDARTGSQNWFLGLVQAFRISIIFQINGIIPICLLTDLPIRAWRTQCGVVSSKRGLVVSLMSPKDIISIFPHERIIGPMTMPFSKKTGAMLKNLVNNKSINKRANIIFTGSLYEPRTTILNSINEGLMKRGFEIEMKGRNLGTTKFADEDYWTRLVNASIIITTSNQISTKDTDYTHLPHLIYRYLEVPASGSLLIAPRVPSIERFFKQDEHFVSFETIEEAIDKIEFYLTHEKERVDLSKKGYEKAHSLINSNLYWIIIDAALGKYSLL